MAFPLTPTVGQVHTEVGLKYKWVGTSWDLLSDFQELVLSTVDPTAADAADIGTVWRNTTDGSAWQRVGLEPSSIVGTPVQFDTLDFAAGGGNNTGNGPRVSRFSFDLAQWTNITSMSVFASIGAIGQIANGTYQVTIFEGEDTAAANNTAVGGLTLGVQVAASGVENVDGNGPIGFGNYWPVTFTDNNILAPGRYTAVINWNTTLFVVNSYSPDTVPGQAANLAGSDQPRRITGVLLATGVWEQILHEPTFQLGTATPTTQASGASLVAGDMWYDTTATSESLYYWDGAAWQPIKTFYDSTLQNVLVANDEQEALVEIDVVVDRLETGVNFVGTYAPSTNTADFTTLSALPDGTLPAANTVGNSFLVVVEQATGQSPAPVVPMNKGDFLVADPIANTWIHVPIGTAVDEFIDYLDTPTTYVGSAGKNVAVNAGETALEFATPADVMSIYSTTAPATRLDLTALQLGDQWLDATTNREKFWDGAVWREQVYVDATPTTPPAAPVDGLLWYDETTSALYIWDATIPQWVAI